MALKTYLPGLTVRITIFITSLILFGSGIAFTYLDKVDGATAAYGAAILCLVFVFLKEIRRFKGAGIEAELLEQKANEADELLTQMRSLTYPISVLLFTMVARGGRLDFALRREEIYRLMTQFEADLRKIGTSDEDIEKAKSEWHQCNLLDLSRPIIELIVSLIQEKERIQRVRILEFGQPIAPEDGPAHRAAIDEANRIAMEAEKLRDIYQLPDRHEAHIQLINIIQFCPYFSETEKNEIRLECREHLQDLQHYSATHEFRRLEVWFQENEQ